MACSIRLVVFDVDGVLVPIKSSWRYVHEALGTLDAASVNYELFRRGVIGYWEWMYLDTLAWIEARPGLTRWDLEGLFERVGLVPGAKNAVERLRREGIVPVIVSGGVDVLVSRVARELGVKHWVSPMLAFDPWGRLVPGGEPRLEADRKDRAVLSLARRLGFSLREVAFVGDSVWDLRGMREACLAVAVNSSDSRVLGEADYVASNVADAVDYIINASRS